MAVHPCPRCGRLVPVGVAYCTDCRPVAEAQAAEARERRQAYKRRQYNTAYNKRRDPRYLEFYRSKAWRLTSRAKLQAAGYKCQAGLAGCTRLAVEVHHIKPIQTPEGWDHRLDWDNLEAVCTTCHNGRHPDRFKSKDPTGVLDQRKIERQTVKTPGGTSENF